MQQTHVQVYACWAVFDQSMCRVFVSRLSEDSCDLRARGVKAAMMQFEALTPMDLGVTQLLLPSSSTTCRPELCLS